MPEIASAYVSLIPSLKGAGKTIAKELDGPDVRRGAEQAGKSTGGRFSGAFKAGVAGIVAGIGVGAITGFANQAVASFSELEDSTAAAGVVFGKNMGAIIKQSKTASTQLGLSQQQVINAANTFGTYGKAAGLSGKELANFATQQTALAADMASFKGTSPEQAIEAIGAALRGEMEPIRTYGVLLDDATLRNEALSMGLIKTTKDALTPQQKTLAAQAAILKQTSDAQGDYARTSQSTANVAKTLAAESENLRAKIGGQLAPAFTAVRKVANKVLGGFSRSIDTVVPKVRAFVDFLRTGDFTSAFAKAFNVEEDSGLVDFLLRVRDIATEVGGGFRAMVAAFQAGGSDVTSSGFAGIMERIGLAARATFDYFKTTVIPTLVTVGSWLVKNKDWLLLVAMTVGTAVIAYRTYVAVTKAWTIATNIMAAAQRVLNAVMNANPAVKIITLIGALVGALVWLYNNNETARRIIDAAWRGIRAAISAVVGWFTGTAWPAVSRAIEWLKAAFTVARTLITNTWRGLRDNIAGIIGSWGSGGGGILGRIYGMYNTVTKLPARIAGAAKGMWEGLKSGATSVINTVIGWLNKLIPGTSWDISLVGRSGRSGSFASGGVLPGYTPGRDVHQFFSPTGGRLALSGGEAIMRPEFTRAVGGPAGVAALNAAARGGQAFAGGGVWTEAFKSLWGGNPLKTLGGWLKDKIFSGLLGGDLGGPLGGGGRAGMGISAMTALVRGLDASARITSGYRPGAVTATGFRSYHSMGRAIDIVSSNMGDTFRKLQAAVGRTAAELYYTGPGGVPGKGLRHGRWATLAPITDRTHRNHIHYAAMNGGVVPRLYDQGGWMPHGGVGVNLSGKPERVLSPAQSREYGDGTGFDKVVARLDRMERAVIRHGEQVAAGMVASDRRARQSMRPSRYERA